MRAIPRFVFALAAISLALASCAAPAASATPVPATPTPIPSPLDRGFQLFIDVPLLELGEEGRWDSGLMDPGSVVYHDGSFHMLFNAIPSLSAPIAVGYAVSADGRTWRRAQEEPVLRRAEVVWTPSVGNIRANSVLVENGVWVMYFSAARSVDSVTGLVGRATALAPAGPWAVDPQPLLFPGPAGAWDKDAVGHVEVLRDGGGFVMYYSAPGGIGRATSTDGMHWEKFNDPSTEEEARRESDPVIAKPGAEDPNVQRTAWGWAMVFRDVDGLAYASSEDGIHWTVLPQKIVVLSGFDVWYSSLLVHNDVAYLYFEAGRWMDEGVYTKPYLATWKEESPVAAGG